MESTRFLFALSEQNSVSFLVRMIFPGLDFRFVFVENSAYPPRRAVIPALFDAHLSDEPLRSGTIMA